MVLLIHDDRLIVAPAIVNHRGQRTEFGFKRFRYAKLLSASDVVAGDRF